MVMVHLCDPKLHLVQNTFVMTLFKFMICMLQGGNMNIQKGIYMFMTTNSVSEVFFNKLDGFITLTVETLKKK